MVKPRLTDANTIRAEWLENGENEYVYDVNAAKMAVGILNKVRR